jgi:Uma2 family endonuclease
MERTVSTTHPFTAEELLRLPRGEHRYELVDGELATMSPAGWWHGAVAGELLTIVGDHVRRTRLGLVFGAATGFLLRRNPDTVMAPDVAFVRRERIPVGPPGRGFFVGAPDFAAEVLSPDDSPARVAEKAARWLAAGVQLLWVVDPLQRTAVEHQPGAAPHAVGEDGCLDGSDVLPGLRIALRDLFAL